MNCHPYGMLAPQNRGLTCCATTQAPGSVLSVFRYAFHLICQITEMFLNCIHLLSMFWTFLFLFYCCNKSACLLGEFLSQILALIPLYIPTPTLSGLRNERLVCIPCCSVKRKPFHSLQSSLLTHKETENGSLSPLVSGTDVRDMNEVSGPWLWCGLSLAIVVIYRMNQWMENLFLSVVFSFTLGFR